METKKVVKRLIGWFIIAPLFLYSTLLPAQTDQTLQTFDHFGGYPGGSAVKGNHVYLIQAMTLSVQVITETGFRRVGYLPLPDEPADIVIQGNTAYLVASQSDSGLQIVDISDPQSPKLTKTAAIKTPWPVREFIDGNHLYVIGGDSLKIINVSDPASPMLKSVISIRGYDLFVRHPLAYIGGSDGLRIVDVSNPSDPKLLSHFPTPGVHGVVVQNGQAYLMGYRDDEPKLDLTVVNVADSTHPMLTGQIAVHVGETLYTFRGGRMSVVAGTAYLAAECRLFTFDVTTPSSPTQIGVLERGEGMLPNFQSLHVVPPFAFAAMGASDHGLVKIDVSNPASPALAAVLEEPWDVTHIFASGATLFVASGERLMAFDYTDPEQPVLAGSNTEWPELYRITVDRNTLYGIDDDSLHIVDVSNPADMREKGGCTLPSGYGPRAVSAHDSTVFLLTVSRDNSQSRLDILNVSNPSNIKWTGTSAFSGEGRDLFVPGDGMVAYAAYDQAGVGRGIHLIGFQNPSSPVFLGSGQTHGKPSCLWVSDTLIYVGSNSGSTIKDTWSIEVFNVAKPSSPTQAGETSGIGLITDLEVTGDRLFASIRGGSVYQYGVNVENLIILLTFLSKCPSPESIFLAMLYNIQNMYFFTCDGAWSPDMMRASASLGMYIQKLLFAAVPVEMNAGPNPSLDFSLSQNHPNPFNPSTKIIYRVKERCLVVLSVFDALGREVATLVDREQNPGRYEAVFNAGDLPSGLYFCRIRMNDFTAVKKMIVTK